MLRKFCPERQAVNLSELEKLLDADSLQKLVEDLNDCEGEQEEKSDTMTGSDSTNDVQWIQANNRVLNEKHIGQSAIFWQCFNVKLVCWAKFKHILH